MTAPLPSTTDPFIVLNDAVVKLMAGHLEAFVREGRQLYLALALILFAWFFIKSALSSGGLQWDRLAGLVLFLSFGNAMTEFYSTPIPGVGYSFSHLVMAQGSWMADELGTETVKEVIGRATDIIKNTSAPTSWLSVGDWATWGIVVGCLSLLLIAVYLVIAFAVVAQAVLILLGPLFVPWFIVPKLDTLFWSWFRCLLAYSFMQVVARAFILVFGRLFLSYAKSVEGFQIVQLAASMPVLLIFTGIALVAIFKVPAFTNQIFSGVSGLSFGLLEGATDAVVDVVTVAAKQGAGAAIGG